MTRYRKRYWVLAVGLSALAGYVDAIGFLKLHGLFVSFMSGNSTRLAVAIVAGNPVAWMAGQIIGAFITGVVVGSFVSMLAVQHRKSTVLALVTAALAVAALLDTSAASEWSVFLMAGGMGAANCVFQRDGEVSIGVTYMTGTLVKFGQRLATALTSPDDRFGWLPYLALWCGLMAGALAGAALYPRLGTYSLWLGAIMASILSVASHFLGPADQGREA